MCKIFPVPFLLSDRLQEWTRLVISEPYTDLCHWTALVSFFIKFTKSFIFSGKIICLPILSSFLSIIRGANRLLGTAAWYLEDQTALIQVRSWPQASENATVPVLKLSRESTRIVMEDHQDSVLKCLSCFGRHNSSVPRVCKYLTSPRQGKEWTGPRVRPGTPARSKRR